MTATADTTTEQGKAAPAPGPDETLDELQPAGIRVIQARRGYRFSLDPVLLCAFAALKREKRVADLGTGAGIIPLLLARRLPQCRILGVEIQPALADRARRSVRLNGCQERIDIVEMDLRERERLPAAAFEAVLANPPFRLPGTGRLAPRAERAAARHEIAGSLSDFLAAAAHLLEEGGGFFVIHLAERLAELLAEMRRLGLEPKRLRCVHSRLGENARLVLAEGRRGGGSGLLVEPPWFVYRQDGSYTDETLAAYGPGDDE